MRRVRVWVVGPSVPGGNSVGDIMLNRIYGDDATPPGSVLATDDGIFEVQLRTTFSRKVMAILFLLSPLKQILAVVENRKRAHRISQHIRENGGADIIIGVTGAISSLGLAQKVAEELEVPWIAHIFDDYIYQWIHPVSRLFASLLIGPVVKTADAVVVNNEVLSDVIAKRGIDKNRIAILRNPVPDGIGIKVERESDSQIFQLLYTGNIYDAQYSALKNVMAAVDRLGELGANIKFDLYTRTPKNRWAALNSGSPFVELHEAVDVESSIQLQQKANLLVLPLAFECRYHPTLINTSSPGKFGEYLSSGTPALVHCPKESFPSVFCTKNQCAIVVAESSVDALVTTLEYVMVGEGLEAITNAALDVSRAQFRESVVRAKRAELFASIVN